MAKRSKKPEPKPAGPSPETIKQIGWRICQFAAGRDGCRCSETDNLCERTEQVARHVARLATQ